MNMYQLDLYVDLIVFVIFLLLALLIVEYLRLHGFFERKVYQRRSVMRRESRKY